MIPLGNKISRKKTHELCGFFAKIIEFPQIIQDKLQFAVYVICDVY